MESLLLTSRRKGSSCAGGKLAAVVPRRRLAGALAGAVLLMAAPALADLLPGTANTLGQGSGGKSRIQLSSEQFDVIVSAAPLQVNARLVPKSINWARVNESLLVPSALLEIDLPWDGGAIVAQYKNFAHIFQMDGGLARVRLEVDLFDTDPIELFNGEKMVATLKIRAKPAFPEKDHLQVDWSCSPFGLKVTGLDDQFVSVGCRFTQAYYAASQRPRLEVTLLAANFRLRDGVSLPYISQLSGSGALSRAVLKNDAGEEREIAIGASVPDRLHRLKLAYGFGPYYFDAEKESAIMNRRLSPSLMLYGNFGLNEKESIRFFEAVVFNGSVFSNFGVYYAYVAANKFDNRVKLVTLLGAQELSFHFNDSPDWFHDIFFPQGVEIVYSHAFGLENYHMIFGVFLSPVSDRSYQNVWLRFGRKYFWEINYINWGYKDQGARMWGLSLGVPLAKLF